MKKKTETFSAAIAVWAVGMVILGLVCQFASKFTSEQYAGLSALLLSVGVVSWVITFLIIVGWISSVFTSYPDRAALAGQIYALTDQRILIKITDPKSLASTIRSLHRGTIKGEDLHRVQYPDGSGDVVFRKGHDMKAGFVDVADVRRVEGLIRRALITPGPELTT